MEGRGHFLFLYLIETQTTNNTLEENNKHNTAGHHIINF